MRHKITCHGVEVEVNFTQAKKIEIPQGQRDVIKTALSLYIEMSKKLNSDPTDEECYRLFDARQLMGMMDYPVYIDISTEEIIEFTAKYGVDFPRY